MVLIIPKKDSSLYGIEPIIKEENQDTIVSSMCNADIHKFHIISNILFIIWWFVCFYSLIKE